MKVSELIEKLTELQDQNGDLRVRVDSDEYYQDVHRVCSVRCDEHRGEWCIDIIIK